MLDLDPIVEAIIQARGTFLQKLASPRFLLAVLALFPTAAGYLSGHLSGEGASIVVAVITAIYTAGEAYVHGRMVDAATDAAQTAMRSAANAGRQLTILPPRRSRELR